MVGSPSIEAIVKAKPDLILGLDIANTQHYQTLSKIAPTLILNSIETFPELDMSSIALKAEVRDLAV
jgi:iron complex transport system substrate-binding protein